MAIANMLWNKNFYKKLLMEKRKKKSNKRLFKY